jgi:hypothetical protein
MENSGGLLKEPSLVSSEMSESSMNAPGLRCGSSELQVLIKLLWNIFDPKQMRREGSFVESAKKSGIGRNQ